MTGNKSFMSTLLALTRSSIWWVVFFFSTIFFAILAMLLVLVPAKTRFTVITSWCRLNIWTLKWICGVKYHVEGRENLPEGAAIVMSKHQSSWETIAYCFIFPPQVWVLKNSLLKIPFFGWGLALLNPIAIDRSAGSAAMEQVVSQGRDRLEKGFWVVVFPEGTRVAAGEKRRYKLGGAVLAAETGYPVVPVAHNAGRLWPKNQFIKWPGEITVSIGPVIQTSGIKPDQINKQAESWIEGRMKTL